MTTTTNRDDQNPPNPFGIGTQSAYLYKLYAESGQNLSADSEILARVHRVFKDSLATRASLQTFKAQLRKGQHTGGLKVYIPKQPRSVPVYQHRLRTHLEKT